MQPTTDRVTTAACMPGLSHGAFRLYAILAGAARQKDSEDGYFTVTLKGLLDLHPGIAGRSVGVSTVLRQVTELQRAKLINTRSTLSRGEPELPVLVRVLEPIGSETQQRDVSAVIEGR